MTDREKELLMEYRYNKLSRIESSIATTENELYYHMNTHGLISAHLYYVVYRHCFRDIMADVYELLKLD